MSVRTDLHSPSNIIPENYRFMLGFTSGTKETLGLPINNDVIMKIRQDRPRDFENIHGGNYCCDVCGHWYSEGELWEHIPTGKLITLGHICARKYSLCADMADYDQQKATVILKAQKLAHRRWMRANMKEFLKQNPEIIGKLKGHEILDSIRQNFIRFGKLSVGQLNLVKKIVAEIESPEDQTNWISVPEKYLDGREEITGTILTAKFVESMYGTQEKVLIQVDEENGSWKAWGTLPRNIGDISMKVSVSENGWFHDIKGKKITLTAKFQKSDKDESFCFMNRPTKAILEGYENV